MAHRIGDIARALGTEAEGDLDLEVLGASEPQAAGPDQLALAMDPRYADGIGKGRARAHKRPIEEELGRFEAFQLGD